MNVINMSADNLAEELLAILDADVKHIEITLGHLNDLRANVIRRDESSLEQLLEIIRQQQEGREVIETRRQKFRNAAAAILGCSANQVNLSRFMEYLSETMCRKTAQRKATIERLVEKLKVEYAATAMLLSECTRFNRTLIDGIIGSRCSTATIYNASGQTQRPNGSGFVTMQF